MRIDSDLDVAGVVRQNGIPVRAQRDFIYAETLWDGFSCPNNGWGIAPWEPSTLGGDTSWFNSADPTKLTTPRGGLYRFTAWWRGNSAAAAHHVYLSLNPARNLVRKMGTAGNESCASMILPEAAGRSYQLHVYQSSGAAVLGTARLMIERMDDV